jgi:hypothetical protein
MPKREVYVPRFGDESSYWILADYIILAGLIRGRREQRIRILRAVKSRELNYFSDKLFPYFLYQRIIEWLKQDLHRQIAAEVILDEIFEFYATVWGYEPSWREVRNTI